MATYHLRLKNDTQPSGTKISVKRHADYILREEGQAHADYINREGTQSDKNDCVFKGSQLPKWAKGSPQKFFSAATRYEDKGNRRYKEIELSLPNELTLEQNRQIVDEFIANHLSNHYYAYAIHEKAGELSGERHPHVHIMFSERLIDDVEKISERPACKYFRRAAKPLKGELVSSFERRREHGAPKDKKWHDKKYLYKMRADFARIQNEVLEQNGFSIRVDHRSLKSQQTEATERGDDFLANLSKRMPESYIGIVLAHEKNGLAADVKRFRENVQSRQHSLFLDDMREKTTEEEETKFLVRQAERASIALINSQAYKSANFEDETLEKLNQRILFGLEKIKRLKRKLVGFLRAREKAQLEYLTAAERKFFFDYKNKLGQKYHLEKFLKEMAPLIGKHVEDQQAFQEIKSRINKKIADLHSFLAENNPQLQRVQGKLEEPYRRKNVELVMHRLLQSDSDTLWELKKISVAVLKNLDTLKAKLEVEEIPKATFTVAEVRDRLFEQCRSLKKEYEENLSLQYSLMFKSVSAEDAIRLAKNIFVHGGFKKLRTGQEAYKKVLIKYEQELSETRKHEMLFNSINWTNNAEKIPAQYYLTKAKVNLEATRQKLSDTKIRLENELTRLGKLCQTEEAREKIALIAASILRKNLKIALKYEEIKKRVALLSQKLQEVKKRFNALDNGYSSLKKNHIYQVITTNSNSTKTATLKENELVAIIADALLGEQYAVQLVARSSGNNLEMEKDWELMSELDTYRNILHASCKVSRKVGEVASKSQSMFTYHLSSDKCKKSAP